MEKTLETLEKGTMMFKVKSVQDLYRRHFYVDLANMRLCYKPSSKKLLCSSGTPFVYLNEVDEVRSGWQSDVFHLAKSLHKSQMRLTSLSFPTLQEERCLSLVLNVGDTLNLVAPNKSTRDVWVQGLKHLVASCKDRAKHDEYNCWIRDQFRTADRNGNGSLSFNECLQLLKTLNVKMDTRQAKSIFNSANFRKSPGLHSEALDPDEFLVFHKMLASRPELESLFMKYSVNKASIWGPQELMEFLHKEQQQCQVSLSECVSLIEQYFDASADGNALNGFLTLRGFSALLLSADHEIFQSSHRLVFKNMKRPLNHYYIASSHNTYLTQGQMMGESSIEGYVKALKAGCRCLEIDMWDGPMGEPVVFHGHTLTSKIFLRDVIETIKQYAFSNSQFPVILSLENHLCVEQQQKAADIFVSILGEHLYTASVGKHEKEYPSPDDLKQKILLKGKKMTLAGQDVENILEEEEEEEHEERKDSMNQAQKPPKTHMLTRQLSDLVNYCKATSFHTFEESNKWNFYEMASFSESRANSMISYNSRDLVEFNSRHLSRIYPGALRVASSNMDPVSYWNLGCQLVALNYQSNDEATLLNKAKFMDNGGCGYIPILPCITDGQYDPNEPPREKYSKTFHFKVISGQFLPKPYQATEGEVVDPYVKIQVRGHPLDFQVKKTSFIQNNGLNPVWNEELDFKVLLPELAIMIIEVKDNCNTGTNRRLAIYALPCSAIASGYRHVHLWNDFFEELVPSTLFFHVRIS